MLPTGRPSARAAAGAATIAARAVPMTTCRRMAPPGSMAALNTRSEPPAVPAEQKSLRLLFRGTSRATSLVWGGVQSVSGAASVARRTPVAEAARIAAQRGSGRALTGRGRLSEAALVRAARRGSEAAVEELFDRHWDAIHRAALLVTGDAAAAEDIAQEAFLSGLRALDRF